MARGSSRWYGRREDPAVIDKLGAQPGETLTPERVEAIQTAMHDDLGRFIDATSYFVLGSYSEEERPRLEAVRDQLASDATPTDTDDDVEAFLMDEILDISEFFTSKFKLLVSYADHIVGVYEHSRGGHAWEAGYIDQPGYRERTRAFYRIYETDEARTKHTMGCSRITCSRWSGSTEPRPGKSPGDSSPVYRPCQCEHEQRNQKRADESLDLRQQSNPGVPDRFCAT